jgi:hypothetical protein
MTICNMGSNNWALIGKLTKSAFCFWDRVPKVEHLAIWKNGDKTDRKNIFLVVLPLLTKRRNIKCKVIFKSVPLSGPRPLLSPRNWMEIYLTWIVFGGLAGDVTSMLGPFSEVKASGVNGVCSNDPRAAESSSCMLEVVMSRSEVSPESSKDTIYDLIDELLIPAKQLITW